MIDKNSPLPIYYQLEEEIKRLITAEQLLPGDILPSEREYTEKYNISRMTVRQAINNLVTEGLLYRQKGKGTFVTDQKFEQSLSGLTSFSEDMRRRGLTPSNQLISLRLMTGSDLLATKLDIDITDSIYQIKRIRFANNDPIAIETTYTPQKIVGDLEPDSRVFSDSFYDFIEDKLQLKITHGNQIIESALANDVEISHLNIQKGDPILLMQRTTYLSDEQETPLEYVKSAYRADKYKFRMQMKR